MSIINNTVGDYSRILQTRFVYSQNTKYTHKHDSVAYFSHVGPNTKVFLVIV